MVKIFKLCVNVLFITVIAILLIYFVLRVTNKVEIYNVKTGSMEDKIHVGDYILIFRKKNYQVGDVVTFIRSEGFITHRIIKMEGNRVTTKGDANNAIDEDISKDNIIGKVIIVGGILNIIINYKYAFAGILLSLYRFSCYLGDGEEEEKEKSSNDESKDTKEIEENTDIKEENSNVETQELEDIVLEEELATKNEEKVVEENKETITYTLEEGSKENEKLENNVANSETLEDEAKDVVEETIEEKIPTKKNKRKKKYEK